MKISSKPMKVKTHITYICMLCICLMTACSEKEDRPSGRNVTMKTSVGEVGVFSKAVTASPYLGSDVSENYLAASLWFSLQSGQYSTITPTNTDTYIPCHTDITFKTNDITPILYNGDEAKALKYPTDGTSIYCVGLYPQNVWSWDATNGFTADITGENDLMFAPEISGTWTAQFNTTTANSQKFSHLLTWIKVVVCASSHEAAQIWGTINSITVNTAQKINVATADGTGITYTGSQPLTIWDTATELSINQKETGSLFCAPAAGYTLTVTTEDGLTASKTMTVNGGFKAGNQYLIVLYFSELSIIDGICSLNSWENQNDNLYLN